jgi:hypothetical protein
MDKGFDRRESLRTESLREMSVPPGLLASQMRSLGEKKESRFITF